MAASIHSSHLSSVTRVCLTVWPPANTILVQAASSLTNEVLRRTHVLENGNSLDDLQVSTSLIVNKQGEAKRCLESLFEVYLDLQASLQSIISLVDSSKVREEEKEGEEGHINKASIRARIIDLSGELISMYAAELSLKQAILIGLSPRDCNPGNKIGLTTNQESDKEYLLTCVSAIAAEVYVSKDRVESIIEGLNLICETYL